VLIEPRRSRLAGHFGALRSASRVFAGRAGPTDGAEMFRADLRHARVMRFLPVLSPEQCNPMVEAARSLVSGTAASRRHAREILNNFYSCVTPQTLAEWTGVDLENKALALAHPRDVPMPWIDRSLEENASLARQVARRELERGRVADPDVEARTFWNVIGPLSAVQIEFELARLESLTHSMRRSGFRQPRGVKDIVVVRRFVDESDRTWWSVAAGNHRVAVAAALGFTSLPFQVLQTIRRGDAGSLPGVKRGYFSEDEAKAFFDLVSGQRRLPRSSMWSLSP
jgi:hypothetical protein